MTETLFVICFCSYKTTHTRRWGCDLHVCCVYVQVHAHVKDELLCFLLKQEEEEEVTYSFRRADLRFSSFSSWAASLSLTSDPGAVAGMMSSWRSLLCPEHQESNRKSEDPSQTDAYSRAASVFVLRDTFYVVTETTGLFTLTAEVRVHS